MKITEIAKEKLKEVLKNNPGKYFRVIFEGYG